MIGRTLGHYRIVAKVGEGGMGEVYRATDTTLDRDVAIKVLPRSVASDRERLARFEREAKMLASLNHPNIAHVYGFETATLDGGVPAHFLAMELVEGEDLAERLARGPIPLNEALAIAKQLAEALEEAHDRGIVHRDLKPANVKATPDGKVKVLDFGLAKAYAGESVPGSSADLSQSPTLANTGTQAGVILGTAAYMSPEQARGKPVDKRADIWAFGVVLYEMLTGRHLFAGETVSDVLAGVLKTEIELDALPSDVPPAIRRLLRRCLERNPKNRLHDVADARLVIDDLIAGRAESPAPTVAARVHGPSRGTRLAVLGTIAVAVATGFLAGRGSNAPAAKGAASSAAFEVRKLTFRPGEEGSPSLSPDGKSLFYVAKREGAEDWDIYFVPIGGRRPIDLTADSTVDDWYPAVSPDGTTIAFRSERDGGGIYLMGTTGESPRRLTAGCFDPAWSPDGARIVCTTSPADDPFDRGQNGRLQILDVATGGRTELATGDAAAPAWSPDGRWIAYWGMPNDESGGRDLWNVAAAGGEPIRLTEDPPYDWNPIWSADGSRLYFLSTRGGGPNLWRLPIDRATGRASGAPESVVLPTEFAESLARGGGRWVFASRSMRATVEVTDLDPARIAPLGAARRLFATTTRLQSLNISPDGTAIAYTTVFPRQDLFVARLDGGAPVQLTDDPANDRFATWDPDGSRILFMSNRSGRYEQWAIRPDGSGLEQLTRTTGKSKWAPSLSPNHRHLAAVSERGTQIYDASGAPPWAAGERIPNPEQADGIVFQGFVWSREGDRLAGELAGTTRSNRPRRIAVWDLSERKLHLFDQTGSAVAWDPAGRGLLIFDHGRLAALDPATGRVRELPEAPRFKGTISFTPDLRRVVAFENEAESDLWLAEGLK